jgi:HSP20 family protein
MAQYSIYRPRAVEGWRGFDELRREMENVFGRFQGDAPSGRPGVFPATNLYDAGDAYVLTAELPGVSPEDIQISMQGTTVSLSGERKTEVADAKTNAHRLERRSGTFRRAFELPVEVDPDKAEAVHKNGVLMLRMPKTPAHQPRRIAVRAS